jgi:hypothetical protein
MRRLVVTIAKPEHKHKIASVILVQLCLTLHSSASESVPELETIMGCDMTATISEAPAHAAHAVPWCNDTTSVIGQPPCVNIVITAQQQSRLAAWNLARDGGRGVLGSGVAGAFVLLFEGLKARSCTTLTYAHSLSR